MKSKEKNEQPNQTSRTLVNCLNIFTCYEVKIIQNKSQSY